MTHSNLSRLRKYEQRLREHGLFLRAMRVREWLLWHLTEGTV